MKEAGRAFRPELVVIVRARDDGKIDLASPGVGFFREGPSANEVVVERTILGELEILGERVALRVPHGARGAVVASEAPGLRSVGYGETLVTLDPAGLGEAVRTTSDARAVEAGSALVFRFASSGRYYARPAPTAEPFVVKGAIVTAGQTVALLEVMKTFNRLQYGGSDVPERARVLEVLASHDSDVSAGDVLLRLEPAE